MHSLVRMHLTMSERKVAEAEALLASGDYGEARQALMVARQHGLTYAQHLKSLAREVAALEAYGEAQSEQGLGLMAGTASENAR